MTPHPAIELHGISKSFGGVEVLSDVDLTVQPGTVHSIVGENGAGKSTLMKIIAGVYGPDEGTIVVDGDMVAFDHPHDAQQRSIGIVYQELNLLPERTVAENVFLGREPGPAWRIRQKAMTEATYALLEQLGVAESIRPGELVKRLPIAAQQMVEIAKALSQDVRLLILDEPTASLAPREVESLFEAVDALVANGISVVYVSHRLSEVFRLSDEITVLKDGLVVGTFDPQQTTPGDIVTAMVGRELSHYYPKRRGPSTDDVMLTVDAGANQALKNISLELRRGEIVGVAGLAGSGRTELVQALFGDVPFASGQMTVAGTPVTIRSPRDAIDLGIGCITEDRKAEGLVLMHGIKPNGLLPCRAMRRSAARRQKGSMGDRLAANLSAMDVRAANMSLPVRRLSGGNQQKVVIAKWLSTTPRILLFDEPTRGIDIGAKSAIHKLIRDLADTGIAVLMVSSELPEVIGMSDRVIVMHDGHIAAELPEGPTEQEIMDHAAGHSRVGRQ